MINKGEREREREREIERKREREQRKSECLNERVRARKNYLIRKVLVSIKLGILIWQVLLFVTVWEWHELQGPKVLFVS